MNARTGSPALSGRCTTSSVPDLEGLIGPSEALMRIDSISLNPDVLLKTAAVIAEAERALGQASG